MKILKQEKKGNQVILDIEEDYSKLAPHIDHAYADAAKEVKVPGFRQGKIPADLLKKYIHEEAVIDSAVQHLISDIYSDIIDSSKIRPVDYPNVEINKLKKGEPIGIKIIVDVYPDIKVGNYKSLKLAKHASEVADEEVDKTIEFVRKDYAKHSNIPENEVVVDDEFAKKVSRLGSLSDLKAMVKANIEIEKKREADQAARDEVTRKLADIVEADIPKGMTERETDVMIKDLETSLKRNRMTLESYLSATKKDMNKLREEVAKSADIRIKAKLALEYIAQKEKLSINDAELDKEIEVIARQAEKTVEQYRSEISKDVLEYIKEYMLKEKAIDFVISKAKVEEK